MRMDVLKSIPQFSVERQTFSGIQCFQCKDDNNHQNPCKYFQMLSQVKPKKGSSFLSSEYQFKTNTKILPHTFGLHVLIRVMLDFK